MKTERPYFGVKFAGVIIKRSISIGLQI